MIFLINFHRRGDSEFETRHFWLFWLCNSGYTFDALSSSVPHSFLMLSRVLKTWRFRSGRVVILTGLRAAMMAQSSTTSLWKFPHSSCFSKSEGCSMISVMKAVNEIGLRMAMRPQTSWISSDSESWLAEGCTIAGKALVKIVLRAAIRAQTSMVSSWALFFLYNAGSSPLYEISFCSSHEIGSSFLY